MMHYREYKEFILDYLQKQLGEDAELSVIEVIRMNDSRKEAILADDRRGGLSPVFYLDGLYAEYRKTGDPYAGAERCIAEFAGEKPVKDTSLLMDWEYIRPRVRIRLVGMERNREYLKNKVYAEMLDLAVLFVVVLKQERDGEISVPVTKELMKRCGFSREELYGAAEKNLQKEYFRVQSMKEIIHNLSKELGGEMCEIGIPGKDIYVVTNEHRLFGARVMCRKDVLRGIAGGFGRNLYILPSSVHELILLKDEGEMDINHMKEIVRGVNGSEDIMSEEDILSDSVYYYDRGLGEIRIVG